MIDVSELTIPQELLPQYNNEAEICTLGAMLLSERACEEVYATVNDSDFYHPAHRTIFQSIVQLIENDRAVDLVTLKNDLISKNKLDSVGGIDYLIQVAESVPSAANAVDYANIVLEDALSRRLELAGNDIVKVVRKTDLPIAEKIDKAEQIVCSIGKNRNSKDLTHIKGVARDFFDDVDNLYESGEPVLGMSSGYYDFDKMTGGFYGSDFHILAARPSMGKTGLAMNFAVNVAKKNTGAVAVFSIEMSAKQLVGRMVSMLSGIGLSTLKKSNLSKFVYDKLADACDELYSLPLYIDDTSDISPLEMRGKCRRLKQTQGLSMVIVDYLQLMKGSKKTENRVQEISEIARSLKSIAKEFDVPVIALSQLNRSVESREDKRPMLSDIRESGSIEAEADLVMFIYRDAYYQAKEVAAEIEYDENRVEEAEIIIAKHRNGPTGKVMLGFHPSCVRFVNLKHE